MIEAIVLLLGCLSAGTAAGALVIRNLYHICQPSEVLIFAGSRRRIQEGQENKEVGYRLVKGGSSIQVPVIERTFRMNLTNMIIDLKVVNAYSKGGIPLTVQGVANIKIAGEEPTIHNAIERLLGKSRKDIEQLAKETLEGTLRGILASLTPEEANDDQIAFAKILLEEAEDDLEQLGIVLDSLQIQNISDDVDYLDSIGRKQQAELLRDARIAEAKAKAESVINASENKRLVALRRIERDLEISKAEAERRVRDALTKRVAIVAEAESLVGAQIAKTQAQVAVQTERIKQVEHQLQADVIAPAEAESKRAISKAKANASSIVEDGKAQVEGIRSLAQSWKAAGSNAKDIFLLQKLDVLLQAMAASIPEVEVQNLTVIDSQGGSNATKMAAFVEQLRQTTGIDVNQLAQRFADGKSPLTPEKPALPDHVK